MDHALWLDKLVEALGQLDRTEEAHGLTWYLNAQIHEVVEGAVLEAAGEAGSSIDELPLEQVRHDRVVTRLVVTAPLLRLLINGQVLKVKLPIRRLRCDTVQLVVHSVDQEAHELLRVLLPIATELRDCSRDSVFDR